MLYADDPDRDDEEHDEPRHRQAEQARRGRIASEAPTARGTGGRRSGFSLVEHGPELTPPVQADFTPSHTFAYTSRRGMWRSMYATPPGPNVFWSPSLRARTRSLDDGFARRFAWP